jgi:hypothetical protein
MISSDPYAAVKFFHFVIGALLEELFEITAYNRSAAPQRMDCIFGCVASYIGTVEAQGRGTLHLHMVVWIIRSLTSEKMKQALASVRCEFDGLF